MRDESRLLLSESVFEQLLQDFPDRDLIEGIQLFRAVRFLAQRMNEATSEWLLLYKVSATKFNHLAVLYVNRKRGLTATELGTSVRTSSGSVTTMIDALVRGRLAARHSHPTDGRSVVIKLTPKGERLYLESARLHHAHVLSTFKALGPERTLKLVRLLVEAGDALHGSNSGLTPSKPRRIMRKS